MGQVVDLAQFRRKSRRVILTVDGDVNGEIKSLEAKVAALYASISGAGNYLAREQVVVEINTIHTKIYNLKLKLKRLPT